MKLIDAREKLFSLHLPAITLQEAMGVLGLEKTQSSRLMNQLAQAKSVIKLKRGIWVWPNSDPLALLNYLTAPFDSYISLQTALFYHGIIEQIPAYYFAVSVGRKKLERTDVGTFSIHHVHTALFTGFDTHYNPYYQMATPEKALFDYLYLSRLEPALFGKLPEMDISKLNVKTLFNYLDLVTHLGTKTFIDLKLNQLLNK